MGFKKESKRPRRCETIRNFRVKLLMAILLPRMGYLKKLTLIGALLGVLLHPGSSRSSHSRRNVRSYDSEHESLNIDAAEDEGQGRQRERRQQQTQFSGMTFASTKTTSYSSSSTSSSSSSSTKSWGSGGSGGGMMMGGSSQSSQSSQSYSSRQSSMSSSSSSMSSGSMSGSGMQSSSTGSSTSSSTNSQSTSNQKRVDAALLDSHEAEVAARKIPEKPKASCFPDDMSAAIVGDYSWPTPATTPAPFKSTAPVKISQYCTMRMEKHTEIHGWLQWTEITQTLMFFPDGPASFFPDKTPNQPIKGVYERPSNPRASSPYGPTNPTLVPKGNTFGNMKEPGFPDVHGYLQSPKGNNKPIFYPDGPSTFFPDADPSNPISGTWDRPSNPTQPSPFAPVDAGVVQPGPTYGNMKEANVPDVHGYIEPTPDGKVMFYPDGPAAFFPDVNPNKPVKGVYTRPSPATSPSPFNPTNPKDVGPGQTPGSMKEPGFPDVHGYVEGGSPPMFYPDGPASFFPDASPDKPVKGVYDRPPVASNSSPFKPTNPASVNPGQTPGNMKETGFPDVHGYIEVLGPGQPIIFYPDGPASFFPDASPDKPVKGVYDRPPVATNSSPFKPTNPASVNPGQTPGNMKEKGFPDVHGYIEVPGPGQPVIFYPDGAAACFPDSSPQNGIRGVYERPSNPQQTAPFRGANIPPGQTPCTMREPNFPDVHGFLESGNPATFHPDPPKPAVPDAGACPGEMKKKGDAIANAKSETGVAGANAITKGGGNALANAEGGDTAKANAIADKCGNATANSKTYGAGGAHSNAMVKGSGHATSNAESLGTGDANSNSMATSGNAQSAAIAAGGGNAKANAVTTAGGNAASQAMAAKGGNAASNAMASGGGSATSGAKATGGGNATAGAVAKGGGDAKASSMADGSGNALSNAKAEGGGNAVGMAVATGGGNAESNAVADGGGNAEAGACAGGPCDMAELEEMKKMMAMGRRR